MLNTDEQNELEEIETLKRLNLMVNLEIKPIGSTNGIKITENPYATMAKGPRDIP